MIRTLVCRQHDREFERRWHTSAYSKQNGQKKRTFSCPVGRWVDSIAVGGGRRSGSGAVAHLIGADRMREICRFFHRQHDVENSSLICRDDMRLIQVTERDQHPAAGNSLLSASTARFNGRYASLLRLQRWHGDHIRKPFVLCGRRRLGPEKCYCRAIKDSYDTRPVLPPARGYGAPRL
jgi:hypothetical protein